ncbi:histidinol phosphatase [bacterium]|nr:MAG: histidinol phosphatase [bacterium]
MGADHLADVFPAGPPATNLIAGTVDFHVHTGPDAFDRALDDDETVAVASRAGMGAIVLKNHVSETASRAVLARKRSGSVEVYGGLVLNHAVGGLNAGAVRWMARIAGRRGRVVWLPTIDAGNHRRVLGGDAESGIEVVHEGKPTEALVRVIQACAEGDLVLQTGHTSADDVLIVAAAARAHDVRVCVTHAMFPVVGFDVPRMRTAAALGVKLELCAVGMLMGPQAQHAWMRAWGHVGAQACAQAIKEVGSQHFILSTDLGQFGNPTPADGYRWFIQELLKEGVSSQEIDLMARHTPMSLLQPRVPNE